MGDAGDNIRLAELSLRIETRGNVKLCLSVRLTVVGRHDCMTVIGSELTRGWLREKRPSTAMGEDPRRGDADGETLDRRLCLGEAVA